MGEYPKLALPNSANGAVTEVKSDYTPNTSKVVIFRPLAPAALQEAKYLLAIITPGGGVLREIALPNLVLPPGLSNSQMDCPQRRIGGGWCGAKGLMAEGLARMNPIWGHPLNPLGQGWDPTRGGGEYKGKGGLDKVQSRDIVLGALVVGAIWGVGWAFQHLYPIIACQRGPQIPGQGGGGSHQAGKPFNLQNEAAQKAIGCSRH
ncbi:hypothetical protein G9A89_000210 [Geosiphon pyriformis]|nr:hypothetical protein G9A89_000210 [Geosiphon pyriformis]